MTSPRTATTWLVRGVLLLLALTMSTAQNPLGTISNVERDTRSERLQRQDNGYTGFVFDFFTGLRQEPSANGFQVQNNVNTNSFVQVLTGAGFAQNMLTLGACAGNNAHSHPRGAEISIIVRGKIQFGFVEENGGEGNKLVVLDALPGQVVHIPQGVLHFSHNLQCEPAAFIANFGNRDPGTQTWWTSLLAIPTPHLAAATNIADNQETAEHIINGWKKRKTVTAPATGGAECMKRCHGSGNAAVDPNYFRLNSFGDVPFDRKPIQPKDQRGNPEPFAAGGVNAPAPVRTTPAGTFTRDDFTGFHAIPKNAGYVNASKGTHISDKAGRRLMSQMMGELQEKAKGLPQDRISVFDLDELVA